MEPWLVVLIVVVVVAVAWYLWRKNAQSAERKRADDARWQQAASEAERAPAAKTKRDSGLLQTAADTASGKEYATATEQLNEMTARLAAAREEADRAAARLAGRADSALAAVQAAAAAHGGAVPGDGTRDCPADYPVKGNMPTRHYHLSGQPSYARTIPEVCFQNAAAAEAAGFTESGDETGVRARSTVARESAELASRDTIAVANAAGGDAAPIGSPDLEGVPPGAIRGDGGRDCPPAYPVKGQERTRRYSEPESAAYATITPQLCFSSIDSAIAAGFAPAPDE